MLVVHYVRKQGACDPQLRHQLPSKNVFNACALVQHVRDGAIAMGDIPALLSHLREHWSEGYDECAPIIAVCKAVEMMASGILVSLREAEAIAEGLHVRARARTPMIQSTSGHFHQEEDEDYEEFKAAAELVAERQQMDSSGIISADHQPPTLHGSTAANTFSNGKSSPTGIVRRYVPSSLNRHILRALIAQRWMFEPFCSLLSTLCRPGDRGRPPNRTCTKCNLLQVELCAVARMRFDLYLFSSQQQPLPKLQSGGW